MKAKRNYRDSLFRSIFKNKKNLLSLYNALEGTDYTSTKEIQITTLKGTFFNDLKNDISFRFRDQYIILLEHQSTVNENMPLRCLFYISKLYQKIVDERLAYRERVVKIPAPKFYVFYNGAKDEPEESELHLSDAFAADSGALELNVKVYNINYEENKRLLKHCRALRDYSIFVSRVRSNIQQKQRLAQAIAEAIDYCLANNIMKDFLEEKVKEVYDMVNIEWNLDTAKEVWLEEGIEKGIEKGMEKGAEKTRMELAVELMKEKFPMEKIVKLTKLSMDKLNELGRLNGLI
ncbi:MAG: Rpn family recombination-promoting nuclease/putative transposase [Selenomonas sp.]|jgi:hypothetical protein|nr:Rpn family recombination-promoting nuclease/putative transposase [Selenomonas sp.]